MNVRVHRAVSDIERGNRDGDSARHRRRRAGCLEAGQAARPTLQQNRTGNCRTIEWALAGGSFVQLAAGVSRCTTRSRSGSPPMSRRSCGSSGRWRGAEQRGQTAPPLKNGNKARMIKKRGQEPKRQALYRMSGVDATQIDAIGVETLEVVLSEYGPDLSRFPTREAVRFPRYLGAACAHQRGQAARGRKSGTAPVPVSQLLCAWRRYPCATARPRSGAYYRRWRNGWAETLRYLPPRGSWPR